MRRFTSWTAYRAWIVALYIFSVGRLISFPTTLYVVATGVGTVHARLMPRHWLTLLFVFGGFYTALACVPPAEGSGLKLEAMKLSKGATTRVVESERLKRAKGPALAPAGRLPDLG